MRGVWRLDIPFVLHREVDDFRPAILQERSLLKEYGLCATSVEQKFIGEQYFHSGVRSVDAPITKARQCLRRHVLGSDRKMLA
jgi:hypothetical protein